MSSLHGSKPCGNLWTVFVNASVWTCLTADVSPGWSWAAPQNEIPALVCNRRVRRDRRMFFVLGLAAYGQKSALDHSGRCLINSVRAVLDAHRCRSCRKGL